MTANFGGDFEQKMIDFWRILDGILFLVDFLTEFWRHLTTNFGGILTKNDGILTESSRILTEQGFGL